MKVHYAEGVASHIGPEPCVGARERAGEASAGEIVGRALSREIRLILGADALREAEGDRGRRVICECPSARRGRRTWNAKTLFVQELGDLRSDHGRCQNASSLVRVGKARSRSR